MSSQIDPVTGLPMYVPPPLEQIPFTKPPFPWNDLTDNPATPRPTYYGDDAIPTVSTLAGMHPTEPRSQTVNTDGKHALLVSDVNSSGGGGNSPVPYYTVLCGAQIGGSIGGPVTDNGIFTTPPPTAIIGVRIRLWITAIDNSGNTAIVNLRLDDGSNTQELNLGYWNVGKNSTIYAGGYYSEDIDFTPPLEIATTYSDGLPPVLFASAAHCDWQATVSLYCLP